MKTLLLALAATVIGLAVGFGLTIREFHSVGDIGLGSPVDSIELGSSKIRPETGIPKLEILEDKEHNFGVMERGTTKSHTFVVTNTGHGPLTLEKGDTSCKCTISELANGALEPGESTEIKLEWTPKEYEPLFHQTAEIRTNDPVVPILVLTVQGKVIQSIRTAPEAISMGSIPMNKPSATELKLYNYADEPVEVVKIEWASDDLASYFSTEVVDMQPADLELDPDAKGGKIVKIQVESGLPLGPINQKIRLTTNFDSLPVLEVPLSMTVTGDISIVGRGYSNDTATLMLGRVRSAEGTSVKLNVLVKGPHREGIEITVGEIRPADCLTVTLGEAKSVKDGEIYMIPLEVSIPKGTRSASHIAAAQSNHGRIVLETNHPEAKEIPIFVRFAVE